MRIVTWNCNQNFKAKFELILKFKPNLLVVQECEYLPQDYFPNAKFFWTGRIENKGLGVLIKNGSASLDPIHNPNLINFLPIMSDDIKILGVWAYNHRAKKFGDAVSGETIQAIEFYKEWLVGNDLPCVLGGDFNNSVIWDKPNNQNNFQNINSKLEDLGFKSIYHSLSGDSFGNETETTFFHTKNESKKYHIDYLYAKSLEAKSITIGKYKDWTKLSDHSPVVVEI